LPSGWSVGGYQWAVSGDTDSEFDPTPPEVVLGVTISPGYGYPVAVPAATWQTATPTWYWSDNDGKWGSYTTETISVKVTLLGPNGATQTINLSQPVNVWAPTVTMLSSNTFQSIATLFGFTLSGISSVPAGGADGIDFTLHGETPALFLPGTESSLNDNWDLCGVITSVQLINADDFTGLLTTGTGGAVELDNVYPYGDSGNCTPAAWGLQDNLNFSDAPAFEAKVNAGIYVNNSFYNYILYTAPGGGSTPVPVYLVDWDWIATATQGINLAITPNPPGQTSITYAGYNMNYPIWSDVFTNSSL
jgi:hypothetical protein